MHFIHTLYVTNIWSWNKTRLVLCCHHLFRQTDQPCLDNETLMSWLQRYLSINQSVLCQIPLWLPGLHSPRPGPSHRPTVSPAVFHSFSLFLCCSSLNMQFLKYQVKKWTCQTLNILLNGRVNIILSGGTSKHARLLFIDFSSGLTALSLYLYTQAADKFESGF